MMDKFEEYYKRFYGDLNDSKHYLLAVQFWQEATKQRDAQYELMAPHTAESIEENAIIGERKRIVEIIKSARYSTVGGWAEQSICNALNELADRIEKSN